MARRSEGLDIVGLALFLMIVPPFVLGAVEVMAGIFGARPRRFVHEVFVGFLVTMTVLPPLDRIVGFPGQISLGISVLVGISGAFLYRRVPRVRSFATVAAPAVVVFFVVFLLNPSIWKIIHPRNIELDSVIDPLQAPPIVFVIFDGLPLVSLLDEKREIDSERYPNFSDLASTSTWFRNATTVSDATMRAIPAIVSGQYPEKGLMPIVQDYPGNLLTVLDSAYNIRALEPVTQFCKSREDSNRMQAGFLGRMRTLLADIGVVYLHVLTPEVWSEALPPISNQWTGFDKRVSLQASTEFDAFVSEIETGDVANTLYFIHSLLPHPPHLYFPSGVTYTRTSAEPSGEGSQWGAWSDNEWAVLQSYKRHLLQVGFVDTLLGKLLSRLREVGLFDEALIVVTADHGMSFRPGDSRRGISETNFPDIMSVPLFVKRPFQVDGGVDDTEVESVDIFPTVAEILAIESPWLHEGRSVFDDSATPRRSKVFFGGERLHFDISQLDAKYDTLERKLALFGAGESLHKFFEIGPFGEELVGRNVSEIDVSGKGDTSIRVLNEEWFEEVDSKSGFVPAELTGLVVRNAPSHLPVALAVAVNGVIRATTWSYPSDSRSAVWSALVDEPAFRDGANTVEVYPIEDSEEGPVLLLPREIGEGTSFLDIRLGAVRVPGVVESGFDRPARWAGGKPVRWTQGSATLRVPTDAEDPPTALRLDIAWIGPEDTTVRVVVNDQEVYARTFSGESFPAPRKSIVMPLQGVPRKSRTIIKLQSDTFVPAETIEGSNDQRELGIAVEGVWLLRHAESAEMRRVTD